MMTYLYAFLIGGGICVIGQILMDATKLTAPRVLVILVTAGALMQACDILWQKVRWKVRRKIFWRPLQAGSRPLQAESL